MTTITDINNVQYSGDLRADSLLDKIIANWNYLLPTRSTLYYTFDCSLGSVIDQASSEVLTTFNVSQQSAATAILRYVTSLTGISFAETPFGTSADLHFGAKNIQGATTSGLCSSSSSYSFTTGEVLTRYSAEAYIFLDNVEFASSNTNLSPGTYGYETLLHEIGHALGLAHPFEGAYPLPASQDNTDNTVMSYSHAGNFKSVFQSYDLLALTWIYGNDGLAGNYGFNSNQGPSLTPSIGADTTAPSVITFSPVDEATSVAIDSNIVLTFNEAISRGTGNIVLKTTAGTIVATYEAATSGNLSISGASLTINPSIDLAYGTGYTVELARGSIKDIAGNNYVGTTSYNFTVASPPGLTITGTGADELFTSSAGNDFFDGGDGTDTARFSGDRSSYTLIRTVAGYTVSGGSDGSDTLSNIERLQFTKQSLALDVTHDGHAGKTLEFIGMLDYSLIKTPTPSAVGTILSIFDQGMSMKEVCQLAIDVGLTRELAGSSTNPDLVKLVFRNVLEHEASAGDVDSLLSYMDGRNDSMSQADFLSIIAGLQVNQDHVKLVGLQTTGVEYTPL